MIAYFDTSALVPLVIEEPGSIAAGELWDAAEHLVSVRLIYPEARAALAQAVRMDRVTPSQGQELVQEVDSLYEQLDRLEVDTSLVRRAGDLAARFALRGYDAVHLAAAERLRDPEIVVVAGDGPLLRAAANLGLSTATT